MKEEEKDYIYFFALAIPVPSISIVWNKNEDVSHKCFLKAKMYVLDVLRKICRLAVMVVFPKRFSVTDAKKEPQL